MSDKTGISWCDATWNPVRGCSRVSEGCRHCYAERVASRFSGPGQPYEGLARRAMRNVRQFETVNGEPTGNFRTVTKEEPRWTGEVRLVPEHLADPLRWKKPRRIFVNSMSDLFHEKLSNEAIAAVFGVMAAAPRHTFQVLTKRAERMRDWFAWANDHGDISACLRESYCWLAGNNEGDKVADVLVPAADRPWPLPNVWLGVSVENQAAAAERIPHLLETPAAVRFISAEPLLGAIDLRRRLGPRTTCKECGEDVEVDEDGCCRTCGLDALWYGLDWVIAGCESGPGARPADVSWFRSLRDQCAAAGVPFFLKQAVEHEETPGGFGIHRYTSKAKAGGVIELPYLDGVQHAAFPNIAAVRR